MPRRRRRRREPTDERTEGPTEPPEAAACCWLCERPLGARVEWHHPRPKSEGGRVTVPVHPICHRALHASFTNKDLARLAGTGEHPAGDPALAPFLRFVARKPPDFHAPTRRRK